MYRSQFSLFLISTLFSASCIALSPEAIEGKNLYPTCHVCHNQAMDPPLGPPIWDVQRRYKNNTTNNEEFVQSMVDFVKMPTLETALHDMDVKTMGLMPPLPLPDDLLKKISTYILEEQFPPPCDYWATSVKRATKKGDLEYAKKDQSMLDQFCKK